MGIMETDLGVRASAQGLELAVVTLTLPNRNIVSNEHAPQPRWLADSRRKRLGITQARHLRNSVV